MKRIVHTIAIIGIVLPSLSSCRAISSFLNDDEAVAGVGNAKLYRKELNALIPKGVSYEDSVRLARQYINTWALEEVFLNIAEEQLSKAEKDVSKEHLCRRPSCSTSANAIRVTAMAAITATMATRSINNTIRSIDEKSNRSFSTCR